MDQRDIDALLAKGRTEGSEEYNMQIGAWDCPACETVGVRGYVKNCPNCGFAKNNATEDLEYLPDGALFYTEDQFNKLADAENPDWECGACGTMMSYRLDNCSNCSAPRTKEFAEQIEYGLGEAPSSTAEAKADRDHRQNNLRVSNEDDFDVDESSDGILGTGFTGRQVAKFALVTAPLAGLLWLLMWFFFFSTNVVEARVVDLPWQRQVSLQEYKTVVEEDWSVPSGGRRLSSYSAVRSYNRVLAGYETKTRSVSVQTGSTTERYACGTTKTGSGGYKTNYCTRTVPIYGTRTETYQDPVYKDVPVYDTKYRYEIEKWVTGRTLQERGSGHNARWPTINLTPNEREGSRTDKYVVIVKYEGDKTYEIPLDEWQWNSIEMDQYCKLEINRVGSVLKYTF